MADYCLRGISKNGQVRFWAIRSTDLCEEARLCQQSSPVATAALGRLLTAGVIMGLSLKEQDQITLKVEGNGPLGQLIAVAEADGTVRGRVESPLVVVPDKAPGKLDVGQAVGPEGFLHVIKDMGFGEPYVGTVSLLSGEIADDISNYYVESEQVPTALALGVMIDRDYHVSAAGGYMVQLLPGATEETAEQLEKNILSSPVVSAMIDRGDTPEVMLEQIMAGIDYEILEYKDDIKFQCHCSREKLEGSLAGLGEEELLDMRETMEQVELTCGFCGKKYYFSKDDLTGILDRLEQ